MAPRDFDIRGYKITNARWKKASKLTDFEKHIQIPSGDDIFQISYRLESPHLFYKDPTGTYLLTKAQINGQEISGPNRIGQILGF